MKRVRDVNTHEAETDSGVELLSPEITKYIESRMTSMKNQIIEEIEEKLEIRTQSHAWMFYVRAYNDMIIRRLFQEWLNTTKGKLANEKATTTLRIAYDQDASTILGDFVSESKTLLQTLQKAKEERNTQAQETISKKLEIVKKVAETEFMPSFPGQGYVDILLAYVDANNARHKSFTIQELKNVTEEVGSISTVHGTVWLLQFLQDLLSA